MCTKHVNVLHIVLQINLRKTTRSSLHGVQKLFTSTPTSTHVHGNENRSWSLSVVNLHHKTFKLSLPLSYACSGLGLWNLVPENFAFSPSSSSIRSSWLYLAKRSPRHGAPVFSWPVPRPTARSAINESSVSPLRCDTCTPQPAFCAILHASIASVTVPIWFTCAYTQW